MSHGGSEQDDDGIAEIPLDKPTKFSNRLAEPRKALVHDTMDIFRIQPLAHHGKSADIGKEHRDVPSLVSVHPVEGYGLR